MPRGSSRPATEGLEVVLTLAGGGIERVKTGPIITGETVRGRINIVAAVKIIYVTCSAVLSYHRNPS